MDKNLQTTKPYFLSKADTAIETAKQNSNIIKALEPYGFGSTDLERGTTMYQTTINIWNNQQEKKECTIAANAFNRTIDVAKNLFNKHRELLRILYKREPKELSILGVSGKMPTNYKEFTLTYTTFYTNIRNNTNLQSKVLIIGLTETEIDAALALMRKLKSQYNVLVNEHGVSQLSSQSKTSAAIALNEWLDDFEGAAKIAFYDNPEMLEILGFFEQN